jgi:hypothetical protein
MASRVTSDFIAVVAEEIASGIDCALRNWLGRIELEVIDRSLTAEERLCAIQQILTEYKIRNAYLAESYTPPAPTPNEHSRTAAASSMRAKP